MRLKQSILIGFVFLFCVFLCLNGAAEGEPYTLAITPSAGGTVSIKVDDAPVDELPASVQAGKIVTATAVPDEGYQLDFWEAVGVDIDPDAAELTFSMPSEEVTLKAVFREKKETYTVYVEANAMGESNFLHKPVKPGETVSVDATAKDGFRFVRWGCEPSLGLDAEALQSPILKFVMPDSDVYLTMDFEAIVYRFRVKTVGKGKVEVEGKEPDADGVYECTVEEEIALTAAPEENFAFIAWSGNNGASFSDQTQPATTLTCPASDFTVTAQFASTIKNLTIVAGEGGSVSPEEGAFKFGVDCVYNLLALPDPGYVFSHWECSSPKGKFENDKQESTAFVMSDVDCTVTAVFTKGAYRLILFASAGGKAVGEEGNYAMNDEISIEAVPLEGFVFSHWESNVPGVLANENEAKTTITMPAKELKVTAVFVLEATLSPRNPVAPGNPASRFPWGVVIVIFVVSGIAIALIIVREQFNLSYRYWVKKAFRFLFKREKK